MKKANKTAENPNTAQTSKINRKKILNNQQVLTDSQKDEIKKAFDFFDITGSGINFSGVLQKKRVLRDFLLKRHH